MSGMIEQSLAQLLCQCGLVPLRTVEDERLPSPDWAWHVAAGVHAPSAKVPLDVADLSKRVEAAWFRLARETSVIDELGTFLIALSRSTLWTRVRLADEFHLAEHLIGDNTRPGQAEFVTMACDGSVMCGVTTEEYDVWVIADSELLHTTPPPPPDPSEVDMSSMNPLQLNRLFSPDRLQQPLRDGWVLLGFLRDAIYLERLHELPEDFTPAPSLRSDQAKTMIPLSDEQVWGIISFLGVPVDTVRIEYFLEFQTGSQKGEQSMKRRLPALREEAAPGVGES